MTDSSKPTHEILDPIHGFIHVSSNERKIIDSPPFQRLRHIHQLGLSYLVYPGATHRRFEHSLGVMELASRVFDIVTAKDNLSEEIREFFKDDLENKPYWRTTLRMAALCHDLGHVPFSHATESLLPKGNHEDVTYAFIFHQDLKDIWETLKISPKDIAKLALGPKTVTGEDFTSWEIILAEIITGDFFGVDRMDYLLRDSYHLGVKYGQFDHQRVIQCLRLFLTPPKPRNHTKESHKGGELILGIEAGGLGAVEAMSLARYFMYSQVYTHPVCRIYEIHLQDFLKKYLPGGTYRPDHNGLVSTTEHDINTAIAKAAANPKGAGHEAAEIISTRNHYRLIREDNQKEKNPSMDDLEKEIGQKYGKENCKREKYTEKKLEEKESEDNPFCVKERNGQIIRVYEKSKIFQNFPEFSFDRIYVHPSFKREIEREILKIEIGNNIDSHS